MKTLVELRELESPLGNQAWMTFQQDGRVCVGDVKLFSDGDADIKTHLAHWNKCGSRTQFRVISMFKVAWTQIL